MTPAAPTSSEHETDEITVRLWAAAKAAAGVDAVTITSPAPMTLREIIERVVLDRPEHLSVVLSGCAVLVGDRPVTKQDPGAVIVHPGESVEFLPPFAGG